MIVPDLFTRRLRSFNEIQGASGRSGRFVRTLLQCVLPGAKNSATPPLARRMNANPIAVTTTTYKAIIDQSIQCISDDRMVAPDR